MEKKKMYITIAVVVGVVVFLCIIIGVSVGGSDSDSKGGDYATSTFTMNGVLMVNALYSYSGKLKRDHTMTCDQLISQITSQTSEPW